MKRRKKFILFIFLIIILVLCFMLFINREKDYTTKYKKDGMTISESYNKEKPLWFHTAIFLDNEVFTFMLLNSVLE